MPLHLDSITYTYPGAADHAVSDITAVFSAGWTGIVGDNGSGKTTLARIACGEMAPDCGFVRPRLASAYCRQQTCEPPAELFDFACSYNRTAVHLRSTLGIDDEWAWRFATLSGGQRRRLQIACALWREPDVLVLDEPTNDIDAETRTALIPALKAFAEHGGIGILISHDRALLDGLCGQCLFMAKGRGTMRPGAFSKGAAQADLERTSAMAQRENARREAARIGREAQRRRQEALRADSRRSKRGLDPRDHDARAKIDLAIFTGKDGAAGRLSSRMESRLERATHALAEIKAEKRYEGGFWTDACVSKRTKIASLPAQTISYGRTDIADTAGIAAKPWQAGASKEFRLEIPDLAIGPTDHIVLTGCNGSGKSTLVNALMESLPEDIARTFIPQEPSAAQRIEALRRLAALHPGQRGRVLSIVARLNSQPERLLEGGDASPGEIRKLMLALGALDSPAILVLDEPANHLDMGSIAALQAMISEFPGALLLVTHDRYMADAVAGIRWRTVAGREPGAFRLHVG